MLSVIVASRPDGGHRDEAWRWNEKRWAAIAPDAEIVCADSDTEQFSIARALNRGAATATGDVLLICGLEVTVDTDWCHDAHQRAAAGALVMPETIHYLNENQSADVLRADPAAPIDVPAETDWSGGTSIGLLMLPRAAFDAVGGYDERHTGWGWEDLCFIAAVRTLWQPEVRTAGNAFHLWHPAPHKETWIQPNCDAQKELWHRYEAAEGDRHTMRALVNER